MALKKVCKWVKIVSVSVLVGELVALYYKDKNFRESFSQAKGFDKCKVLFNGLVDLNKELINDLKSVDYESYVDQYKAILNEKLALVEEKINLLKEEAVKLHNEKVLPVLDELQKKYEELSQLAKNAKEDFVEKYSDQLKTIEEKIEEVKSKLRK